MLVMADLVSRPDLVGAALLGVSLLVTVAAGYVYALTGWPCPGLIAK